MGIGSIILKPWALPNFTWNTIKVSAECHGNLDYKGKQERRRAQKRSRKTSNSDQFMCLTVFPKSGSISQLNPLVKD